jgi:hypothetical protein
MVVPVVYSLLAKFSPERVKQTEVTEAPAADALPVRGAIEPA